MFTCVQIPHFSVVEILVKYCSLYNKWDYLGGRKCNMANMAESGVECLNRVKTAQKSKKEGKLKGKKT